VKIMPAPVEAPAASGEVVAVADTFVQLMRTFGRQRARLMAAAEHDVEWSAQMLLKSLAHQGPTRASKLAECVHADPSTVSRQVAALVKEGLVERRADPEDGRASLLVLTEKADEALRKQDELRDKHFARMLAGWSEKDLRRFATLLARFTDDLEVAGTEWITERIAASRARVRATAEAASSGNRAPSSEMEN
jgi:DNA-binding MarR family transcriptional regulator